MGLIRYQFFVPHEEYNDAVLHEMRNYYECDESNKKLTNDIINKGFDHVKFVYKSISVIYNEYMIDTDKELTESEISALEKYLGGQLVGEFPEY